MSSAFDVKSARIDALAVRLHTADAAELETYLKTRAEQYKMFSSMPFVLDMHDFTLPETVSLDTILNLFQQHGLNIIGLRHEDENWASAAAAHQLPFSQTEKNAVEPATSSHRATTQPETGKAEPQPAAEIVAPATSQSKSVQPQAATQATVLITAPVRTGQQIYAEDADLIVTGVVSEGAEIIADGNIHVYGPMRGRALAGASGNRDARIFIHSMQAELVSVAGIYRNFEQDLPAHLHKQPVQILLQGDRLVISAIDAE